MGCFPEGSGRERGKGKKGRVTPVDLPVKGTKVAFVFTAGAGAMQAILAVTEKLEADLGIRGLGSVTDVAAGISSGSLLAASLTYDNPPKINSKDLKAKINALVRQVFPDVAGLIDELINVHGFSLPELEAIFLEINKAPPDMSSPATISSGLEKIMLEAAKNEISIKGKLEKSGAASDFITTIAPKLGPMVGQDLARAATLTNIIKTRVLSDVPLDDAKVTRMMAYAEGEKKPVFFGPPAFASFVDGPYAVNTTKLHDGLVSSSAIPRFIKAPINLDFKMPDGSVKTIPDLKDGVFATKGGFDPSAVFYDIFSKMFAGEDLLIVYIGNGSPRDREFRSNLNKKYGFNNKISQQITAQGKKITYVAIDLEIKDENGKNLFNISSFYANDQLAGYMNQAAQKSVQSKAYKWVLDAIKTSKGI
jgi:hypothetical protein